MLDRVGDALLERESELRAIDDLIAPGRSDSGAVVLISGPAGIGKTRLLDALMQRAAEGGYQVHRARAAELESDLAWGVVHQLFAAVIRGRAADGTGGSLFAGAARLALAVLGLEGPSAPDADAIGAALHGLYWLTSNLAERGSVVLAVDDVQWADRASARFVDYLARRLEDLPIVLAVTVRTSEPDGRERVSALRGVPQAVVLELAPLSERGGELLLARIMDRRPEPEFAFACHAVTGGNPYLLRELGGQLARDRIAPDASQVAYVRDVTPESVVHAVLLRLSRLPADARRLAESVAVLGGRAVLAEAARLAEIDEVRAIELADELGAAGILGQAAPLEFVHPLVRSAIYAELPALARAAAHARAARILDAADAGPDAVATQLLQTQPTGDQWVVDTLVAAAGSAMARGAPEAATDRLRRALAEPPALERRPALLLQLGLADFAAGAPAALEHLREAHHLAADPAERARAAAVLAGCLVYAHRPLEAYELSRQALAELAGRDDELEFLLEAARLTLAWHDSRIPSTERRLAPRFHDDLPGDTLGERALLGAHWSTVLFSGQQPAAVAIRGIERVVADGRFPAEAGPEMVWFWQALFGLQVADALDLSERCLRAASEQARAHGSITAQVVAAAYRSHGWLLRGSLAQAKAEADQAFELHERTGAWPQGRNAILYVRMESLLAMGRLGDAEVDAARLDAAPGPMTSRPRLYPFSSRGLLRMMQGRFEEALTDLLYVGRSSETPISTVFPWRTRAAQALAALGRRDEAHGLLEEDARFARAFDTARVVGANLRARAALTGGDEGVELLRESVSVLANCPSTLERSQSLVALGSALRRAAHRAEAIVPLQEGLELAERSGATPLIERARRELVDAGARPHRPAHFGRDQLTPSELRVTQMASEGLTNKQIAQALFISLRTVETHLTHAYDKLGVTARKQLGAALAHRSPRNPCQESMTLPRTSDRREITGRPLGGCEGPGPGVA